MSIKIRTEKVVLSDGIEARKILLVEALAFSDLPKKYLNDSRCVYYYKNSYCETIKDYLGNNLLTVDNVYSEEEFQKKMKKVVGAGEFLKEVNKELKEKRAAWNGEETFII